MFKSQEVIFESRPNLFGKSHPIKQYFVVTNPLVNPLLKSISCVPPPSGNSPWADGSPVAFLWPVLSSFNQQIQVAALMVLLTCHWKVTVPGGFPENSDGKSYTKIWILKGGYRDLCLNCVNYVFPKKLGLDSKITSWDLKNQIPCRKLHIQSYS